jgi:DNA polymerase III gamma/tau subunit
VTGRKARRPAPTPSGHGPPQIDHAGQQIDLIANPENIVAQARRDTFGAKQAARAATSAPLVIFEDARRQIAEAATVDQVNKVLALATDLAAAARKATDKELEAEAAVLKFEAERKLGQLMGQQKEIVGFNVGTRGSKVKGARVSEKPTLKDAGIDKNTAHRARKARAVPEAQVEKTKDDIRARVMAPSATREKPAKGSVGSRDIALKSFNERVLELVRLTRNREPERFASPRATSVSCLVSSLSSLGSSASRTVARNPPRLTPRSGKRRTQPPRPMPRRDHERRAGQHRRVEAARSDRR